MLNSEPPCHSDHLIPGRSFAPNQSKKKKKTSRNSQLDIFGFFQVNFEKKAMPLPLPAIRGETPSLDPFFLSKKKSFKVLLPPPEHSSKLLRRVAFRCAPRCSHNKSVGRRPVWFFGYGGCFFPRSPRRALATSKLLRACAKQLQYLS